MPNICFEICADISGAAYATVNPRTESLGFDDSGTRVILDCDCQGPNPPEFRPNPSWECENLGEGCGVE